MRRIIMMGLLGAGSLLMAGGPALAQDATTSTTTSTTALTTASTTVDTSSYNDDWYHAYYCWIVAKYGRAWNLVRSFNCDGASAGTTTTMNATTTASTTVAPSTEVVASLLTSTTAPVAANANSWVTLNWTVIGGNADFFKVTATADKGVSATYPGSTRGYTSLHGDEHLANLELDYTTIKLTVPAGVTGKVTLSLHMTDQTDLRDNGKDYTVTVPVAAS